MKKLQILGTGCPKCKKLAENTRQAADELGIDYSSGRGCQAGRQGTGP